MSHGRRGVHRMMAGRMTAQDTTRALGAPGGAARTGAAVGVVPGVSGAQQVAAAVTAVVVTRGRSPFLSATLEAVRAQEYAPDRMIVVDVDASPSTGLHPDLTMGGARFVAGGDVRCFGEAVDAALATAGAPETGWLWLLHDDSAPAPDALALLLRAVEHSSAVAIAGCKQRRWPVDGDGSPLPPDDGAPVLVEVGCTVSPLGRRMTGIDDTEIDQGQHDAREDVLAVGLAGALVRRSVWSQLGGTDPEVGPFGDGLDLCRRARLAGHRVVVVPEAVVHHAQASLLGLRDRPDGPPDARSSAYARRRVQLYQRLAGAPLPLLPVLLLAMVVWAPFAALYRIALKRPQQARDELVAALVTAVRLVPLARARRRTARTSRLPRRVLRPLLGTWRDVAAERRDARLSRAEAQRNRWAPSELERAELRRLARARRTAVAIVMVAVVALAVVLFGSWQGVLAAGGRVTGGALLPAPGNLGDVWQAATSGWVRDGLGTRAPADPVLLPLTVLSVLAGGSLQVAVNVLVTIALPLAALGGWFAAGAVTRSVWARSAGALVWVAAPAFLAALGSGRIGAVLVHLVLPWVLVALLRSVGVQARDTLDLPEVGRRGAGPRRGSLGAAGAAGLLLAVAVCAAPVLLVVAVVGLGVGALVAPRHRRYLLLALLPALVVALPFWGFVLGSWSEGGWRLLVAEPGVPLPLPGTPQGVELVFGLPGQQTWFGLEDAPGALGAVGTYGPWLTGGLVLLLATVALLRRRNAAGVRTGWFVAALGLGAALVAVTTTVAGGMTRTGEPVPATGWPGAGLSVLLLGLGTAALIAVDTSGPARLPGWVRTSGAVAVAVLALALPAAGITAWASDATRGPGVAALRPDASPVVPAVGQQMQGDGRAARVLELDRDPSGVVDYTVMHANGSRLQDSSTVVRARDAGLVPGPVRADVALLDATVAAVSTGVAPGVAEDLARLGVGAVQVPAGGDRELTTTLDLVPGLVRVTESGTLVWRVTPDGPAPSWAAMFGAAPHDGQAAVRTLRSDGTSVTDGVGDGRATRTLALAESADPGWRAALDGRPLAAVESGGLQAFALGPDGGRVEVSYEATHRTAWVAVAGAVLLVFALLALPVGRRRGR